MLLLCHVTCTITQNFCLTYASVHIFFNYSGKPNPPTTITITDPQSSAVNFYFGYQFKFSNNYCSSHRDYTKPGAYGYVVEVYIDDELCTFPRQNIGSQNCSGWLNLDTKDWVNNYEQNMYVRVAANVSGVLSDFLPYMHAPDGCRITLKIDSKSDCKLGW